MLYWRANFNIPNACVQAAEVYVRVFREDTGIIAEYYSDPELTNMIMNKQYSVDRNISNYEDYLLSLEEYSLYTKI